MGNRTDPLISFHFGLDVGSFIAGAIFTEVSGLGSETEVTEYKTVSGQGSDHIGYIQKIPGRLKWESITLKRGITSNTMDAWKWRKMVEDGNVEGARSNGTITMFDDTGAISAQWNFVRGWPSKITGPSIKSDSNEVGIEEMTIVHEGIVRAQ
jgi:phage tail-like protein